MHPINTGTESRAALMPVLRHIVNRLNVLFAEGVATPWVAPDGSPVRSHVIVTTSVFIFMFCLFMPCINHACRFLADSPARAKLVGLGFWKSTLAPWYGRFFFFFFFKKRIMY